MTWAAFKLVGLGGLKISPPALLVYVDHVLLASDTIMKIERLKTFLDGKFTIKDLG